MVYASGVLVMCVFCVMWVGCFFFLFSEFDLLFVSELNYLVHVYLGGLLLLGWKLFFSFLFYDFSAFCSSRFLMCILTWFCFVSMGD